MAGGFLHIVRRRANELYQLNVTKMTVTTLPTGERVIIDPAVTATRVYHYFYLFINIGALVGQIGMVYCEYYVGFWLSFTLPTIMLCKWHIRLLTLPVTY